MEDRELWLHNEVAKRYKWLVEKGYDVFGVFLYGSQNYKMDLYTDEYMSDVDVKAFVMPSLDDVVRGAKMVSTTLIWHDGSHVEVKDVRLMADLMSKANPAYLELLFTDYFETNLAYKTEVEALLAMRDEVVEADLGRLMNACFGMFMEKKKALRHPYPGTAGKVEEFGYDPKQLHHMRRLYEFARTYFSTRDFKASLVPKDVAFEVGVKKGFFKDSAVDEVAGTVEGLFRDLRQWAKEEDFQVVTETHDKMREYVYRMVRRAVVTGLRR